MTIDETFDVGVDTRTPVDDKDYKVPFRFTGKLDKVDLQARARRSWEQMIKQLCTASSPKRTTRHRRIAGTLFWAPAILMR